MYSQMKSIKIFSCNKKVLIYIAFALPKKKSLLLQGFFNENYKLKIKKKFYFLFKISEINCIKLLDFLKILLMLTDFQLKRLLISNL